MNTAYTDYEVVPIDLINFNDHLVLSNGTLANNAELNVKLFTNAKVYKIVLVDGRTFYVQSKHRIKYSMQRPLSTTSPKSTYIKNIDMDTRLTSVKKLYKLYTEPQTTLYIKNIEPIQYSSKGFDIEPYKYFIDLKNLSITGPRHETSQYLYGSISQRKEVLRAYVDTLSVIRHYKGMAVICLPPSRIKLLNMDFFMDLVWSLGGSILIVNKCAYIWVSFNPYTKPAISAKNPHLPGYAYYERYIEPYMSINAGYTQIKTVQARSRKTYVCLLDQSEILKKEKGIHINYPFISDRYIGCVIRSRKEKKINSIAPVCTK